MPALLGLDVTGGLASELLRYLNATVSSGGTAIGTGAQTYSTNASPSNRVIQVLGDIYVVAENGIYVKDDPTALAGTWTLVNAFTSPDTVNGGGSRRSGIYLVYIDDVPHLTGYFGHSAATNQWTGYTYNLSTSTYTEYGPFNTGFSGTYSAHECVYRNQLFTQFDATSQTHIWDPATGTFSVVNHNLILTRGYAVFNDRLVMLGRNASHIVAMYEYTGGLFVKVSADFDALDSSGFDIAVFNGALYAFTSDGPNAATNYGTRITKFDDAYSITDVTNVTVPATIRSTGRGGSNVTITTAWRHRLFVDQSNPAAPRLFYYKTSANTSGSPWTVYEFTDDATLMTAVDTGGDIANALPFGHLGGGSRIWTPGELDTLTMLRENALGGEKLTVRASGDAGFADKTLKIWFNKQGEPTLTLANLMGPVTGGAAALNGTNDGIVNVDADKTTDYTFLVDFDASGINAGDRVQYYPEVTI